MFSGLTNQVSSWMGAAKGEPQDEEVPTPTKEATGEAAAAAAAAEGEKLSPTKGGSKLDLITNVKSQMTGWLGSGIPIPGLRKNEPAPAEPEAAPVEPAEVAEPRPEGKDDDDNSSATGGADSRPASTGGTPTEEQPGGVGNVTTKAVAGAKSLGNFLYSAVNKAGAKVSEASAKIKKTVEENSILGEFNREQDAFIKGQEGRGSAAAVPPWVGAPNEPALKEECLSLSTDRRNFVRAPPAGVEFDFDYDKMYPVAVAIMGEDPNLEKMRFDLVPKVITEENFWRNYFYRLSLICQANEADAAAGRQSSADDSQDDDKSASDNLIVNEKSSQESIDDVKKRIKSLKVDRENEDEQWEKELEAELKEYEVVADKAGDDKQWEKECEDLLGDDMDLK
ncbi:synapse-associated protein of 47 kDa isoform X4 [Helicoverpa armigera]|uniref:synapse-associated protein of 47 kDa isoform X7 n=1 Tax=Helicoverpa zea TaxID=7113 RepID=UPI001F571825|nr:synapse-associated protein of 47 kDa isoform X7 [Helicoverpa zea]XP_049693672.1 synapse-associated protein of 47 kDa isoform X4 [Helicoverpa armigera]